MSHFQTKLQLLIKEINSNQCPDVLQLYFRRNISRFFFHMSRVAEVAMLKSGHAIQKNKNKNKNNKIKIKYFLAQA